MELCVQAVDWTRHSRPAGDEEVEHNSKEEVSMAYFSRLPAGYPCRGQLLTMDHRLEENASGGEVGPLGCWPGGLCLSRSIGCRGAISHVDQVKLSNIGGRLIIDQMVHGMRFPLGRSGYEAAAKACRLPRFTCRIGCKAYASSKKKLG
uniref:Uncharacterized protein n=1 Tax=Oryza glumipatula TaxID=40148 RepID=A0A0E0APL1_9ORYZ